MGDFFYWEEPVVLMDYAWPSHALLQGFKFDGMKVDETPTVMGPDLGGSRSFKASIITSDGPNNGIIWTLLGDPAKLVAHDATNGQLLYSSPASGNDAV